MSDYGYAYGASAALTAAAAPFNNLALPAGNHLEHEDFDHDEENAVDFEYLGYEHDEEHAGHLELDFAVDADADADAEAGVIVDADYDDDELGDIDIDIDIYNQHFRAELGSLGEDNSSQPLSPTSLSIVPWHSSPDWEQSRSEGGVVEEEDDSEHEQDEHAVQQQQHHSHNYPQHYEEVTESEDDRDQISQSDVQDFDSPTHHDLDDDAGFGQDHAGDGSSSQEHFVISIVDNSSDDEPQSHSSSRTASLPPDGAYDGITLLNSSQSLSVTPPLRRFQSGANSRSDSDADSDLIPISDIEPTSSGSGTASQQHLAGSASGSTSTVSASSSSQGSRSGPREPHRRQRLRRLSVHSGLDINLQSNNNNNLSPNNNHHHRHQQHYHHHRPSPRLSSLTPVLHPNRRLPRRQSPANNRQSPQNFRPATASSSDSSTDELILPPPQRRLGIERTRRPIFTNIQSSASGQDTDRISSDSSDSPSSGDPSPSPYLGQLQDHNPVSQHRPQRLVDRSLDGSSDQGEDDPLGRRTLSRSGEEESDNLSQSDLEEITAPNNLLGGGRSRAGGPARGPLLLDGVHEDHDGDIVLQDHQEYHEEGEDEDLHIRAAPSSEEDEEEFLALVARQSPRRRQRLFREIRQQQEREAAARAQRRRIAANPFLDSDLEQSDANMDGDDELVEVVFDRQLNGPNAPPLQRQPRLQQRHRVNRNNSNNNNNNNRVQAVELIDLTEEPDSPVQNHSFQNQGIAHQHFNRHPQRPRHHRRMPQNGQPPSLARSDGSLLGGQRGPAVIDLTNDEPDFQAVVDDDDDDDLFVGQDFDDVLEHLPPNDFDDFLRHIPPNRRLPDPVPGPPHRDRRRSVEFIGFAARHLRNVGGQYLPGLLAALPGIPRGIANEIAIIGRDQGLAMNPNPLADNPPDFNYQANGFGGRPPPPKPEFEAPPPARPGFTRNTGKDPETGEELVIVCASCDNELKYDEEEDDGPRPAKRPRNKKDREEHHFWAVKACGHVSTLALCSSPALLSKLTFANRFYSRSTANPAMTTARRPKARSMRSWTYTSASNKPPRPSRPRSSALSTTAIPMSHKTTPGLASSCDVSQPTHTPTLSTLIDAAYRLFIFDTFTSSNLFLLLR